MGRLWPPYTALEGAPAPLIAAMTHGARIRLADGRELIDGVASWWTACHGYNHPAIISAMTDQLGRMPHIMFGGLSHDPAIQLADRLCAILPGAPNRVFLSDSGSVAIEVAMKMAVRARSWAMASRCGAVSVGRRWQSLVSSAKATGSALGSMHMIVTFRQNARTPCPGCRSGPSLLPAQPVPASSRGDAVSFSEAVADVA